MHTAKIRYLMQRAAFVSLPWLVLLCGCIDGRTPGLRVINQTDDYSEEWARQLVTESLAESGATTHLDWWTLTMVRNVGERCPSNAMACTSTDTLGMSVPFTSTLPTSTIAYLTCHEAMHAVLWDETGDPDSEHIRHDLFQTICRTVSARYAD